VLVAGGDEGTHLEVSLQDDLANDVVHPVQLLRLVADSAPPHQSQPLPLACRLRTRELSLHRDY
jgi:hypothetical protein